MVGVDDLLNPRMHEGTLQELCEQTLRRYGWLVYHEGDSRKSDKGLPDLIALSPLQRDGTTTMLMLELKTEKGVLSEEQELWQIKLGTVGTIVTGVMRPAGWRQFVALCFDPTAAVEATPPDPSTSVD